jgi:hypothetical protein
MFHCMRPNLEGARNDIWDRPGEDGKKVKRPTSLGQLLGISKWEKPLDYWITGTVVGRLGLETRDKEDERIQRNAGW